MARPFEKVFHVRWGDMDFNAHIRGTGLHGEECLVPFQLDVAREASMLVLLPRGRRILRDRRNKLERH